VAAALAGWRGGAENAPEAGEHMQVSRRQFLMRLGAAGGSLAVMQGMLALGLMPVGAHAEDAQVPRLTPPPRPTSVLILGAGLSGLVAAYELAEHGYDCHVLEASHRAGGRSFTVRGGDLVDEIGNRQVCKFDRDPGLYFNAGPARIPAHHRRVLTYCRKLGVPLEVFVNYNGDAWIHDDKLRGGQRVRLREYVTDARGFLAEMLSKNVNQSSIDRPLSGEDQERMLDFLRRYGDLAPDNFYRGSARAGYASGGIMAFGEKKRVLDFSTLLASDFWRLGLNFAEGETMQAPLMQMVGGNDGLVRALSARLGERITLGAQVTDIHTGDREVRVRYRSGGEVHEARADYCLNCIPGPILHGIRNNFPEDFRGALRALPRGHLIKVAFQARERFWEDESIYGGISWTTQPIQQIIYPSAGLQSAKGVLIGAYIFNPENALRFTQMPVADRLRVAAEQGERLHPGYSDYLEAGVSVAWRNMNHHLGCAAHVAEPGSETVLRRLREPVGRHQLIGDQTTFHSGWQEGAIGSALAALETLSARVHADV
jgi:monoamine oxidase